MSIDLLDNIDNNDIDKINSYIESRRTAILVIMFTDIVGFTKISEEMGDKYVGDLLEDHNSMLSNCIERDDRGKVIKYIGDSVMAVFSEPTRAVQVALNIQDTLTSYNRETPKKVPLKVRIGLHMGQVTLDDKLQGDIFGRHVNRASRIESLAGPNQIYMSLPVFDSAKGWIQDRDKISWQNHGFYYLKGIEKEVEIYQVYNRQTESPKPPQKGKKRRTIPSFLFTIIYLILGVVVGLGISNYEKKAIYLFDFNIDYPIINGEDLFLDGNPGDHKREVLNDLKIGEHILYYDVSPYLRYYSPITINRGENLIDPQFKEARTPYLELETSLEDGLVASNKLNKEFVYYSDSAELIREEISMELKVEKSISNSEISYKTYWKLFRSGELFREGEHNSTQNRESRDSYRTGWIDVETDTPYKIRYKISTRLEFYSAELMIGWY